MGNEQGPHAIAVLNDAARELLSFLCVNGATVHNVWFQNNDIYKQIWQHSKSKQWHCSDYTIMRKVQRWRCLDVVVKRGAVCNTDHRMLLVKMRVLQVWLQGRAGKKV